MRVFTAQPTSTLLASLLLAVGFALLGTVLLAFVFAYRTTYGVLAQRVLIGTSCNGPAGNFVGNAHGRTAAGFAPKAPEPAKPVDWATWGGPGRFRGG